MIEKFQYLLNVYNVHYNSSFKHFCKAYFYFVSSHKRFTVRMIAVHLQSKYKIVQKMFATFKLLFCPMIQMIIQMKTRLYRDRFEK